MTRRIPRGKELKDFDQWTEEISKQVVPLSDEEAGKAPWKPNETLVEDDFEEEE